ncbi:MAG: hypothetical protein AB1489_00365 [Acidobacteriota bacterium]
MDYIDQINYMIQSISLPLLVPAEAFYLFGQPRPIPDVHFIIAQLPTRLMEQVNLEASVIHKKRNGLSVFHLPLMKKGYLLLKIQDQKIIEIDLMLPQF